MEIVSLLMTSPSTSSKENLVDFHFFGNQQKASIYLPFPTLFPVSLPQSDIFRYLFTSKENGEVYPVYLFRKTHFQLRDVFD